MNPQPSLETFWRSRLDAMARAWPQVRDGDAEALHQTRVASRRIREALPVIAAGVDRRKLRKLRGQVREVTRLLGPARALDVELGVLAGIERSMPAHRAAVALLGRHLAAARQAIRKRLIRHVDRIDVKKLLRRLARFEAGRPQSATAARSLLAARTVQRGARLREAVTQAGALYGPERLHAVRLATKKLRYVLEVGQEAGLLHESGLLESLKSVQQTLGRLHDLQSLQDHARDVQASVGREPESASLERLEASLEHECRRLHAEFMVRQDDLLKLCDYVRRKVARDFVRRPPAARAASGRSRHGAAAAGREAGAFKRTREMVADESGERHG